MLWLRFGLSWRRKLLCSSPSARLPQDVYRRCVSCAKHTQRYNVFGVSHHLQSEQGVKLDPTMKPTKHDGDRQEDYTRSGFGGRVQQA